VKKKISIVAIIVIALLILDQVLKVYIKTSFQPDETRYVFGSWFALHYIENQGMAFGTTFGSGMLPKLALSIFRIVAIVFIAIYFTRELKNEASLFFLVAIGFVWAGATGNLIDSMFYDFIFPFNPCDGFNQVEGSGVKRICSDYGFSYPVQVRNQGFLLGNVVDMFQFDVAYPSWVPYLSGKQVFPAIWNLADASITTGVGLIIIRQRSIFSKKKEA